ncbi:MAG TPA: carboxypeptidase regulatory-like domain-containing protein [Gemmatimonadaceae bacterium]
MKIRQILAALLFAVPASVLSAQGLSVSGVVHDSISNTPLEGAMVQIAQGEFTKTATSDATGRYMLSDIPPGTYTLGFFHPVLDSIGVEAPTKQVTLSNRGVIVDLSVPSPARLRTAICGPAPSADSVALIIGTVRDAATDQPATGVKVTGEWLEYVINRGGMNRHLANMTATTGENGWFALCNLPGSGTVALKGIRGSDTTGVIEVQIPSSRFLRREIYVGSDETETVAAPVTNPGTTTVAAPAARVIHIGNGKLTGKVVALEGGQPLANAIVMVVDGPFVRTNDQGEFTLTRAPTGTQMVEIRAVGYYPHRAQVNVVANAAPLDVKLSTLKAVLDTVKIIAKRLPQGPGDGGFLLRRRQGFGRFMAPQDIVKLNPINTSDLFRHFPGVRFSLNEFGQPIIQVRGAFAEWCEPAIFINGMNVSFMDTSDIDTWVKPQEVAGIEVYSGTMVPGEFQEGLRGCGSLVIWTR